MSLGVPRRSVSREFSRSQFTLPLVICVYPKQKRQELKEKSDDPKDIRLIHVTKKILTSHLQCKHHRGNFCVCYRRRTRCERCNDTQKLRILRFFAKRSRFGRMITHERVFAVCRKEYVENWARMEPGTYGFIRFSPSRRFQRHVTHRVSSVVIIIIVKMTSEIRCSKAQWPRSVI